jgi:glycerophosphoryl diester phosphodiesterase
MRTRILFLLVLLVILCGEIHAQFIPKFDVMAHRGSRDLKPENTVAAFITALDSGVTSIEMDVVITKDKKVIVSHEPWMSSSLCLKPDSSIISKKEGKSVFNIYKMTYDEIKYFDCGSKGNQKFPDQEKIASNKPLLEDVIMNVEHHIKSYRTYEVDYAIEIKSNASTDKKFHPKPEEYSDLVFKVIDDFLPLNRVVIQSKDIRVLKYWHKNYPMVRLCYLVDNTKSIASNLSDLGFYPSIYAPYHKNLKREHVKELKDKKIRVIPWTVNEFADMQRCKNWGVDGIITDFPQRANALGLGLRKSASSSSTAR